MSGSASPEEVAEAAISVYNSGILKHYLSIKSGVFTSLAVGLLAAATITGSVSFAQSPVQTTNTSNGLQPQASATQNSANTQNQVGTLQNNNGGSVLNQAGNKPLGVVSRPNQTKPDAIVAPSSTAKAELSALPHSSVGLRVVLATVFLLFAVIGALILRFAYRDMPQENSAADSLPAEKPAAQPEPLRAKSPKDRKQQRRKKKKKSNRR